ncbi:MAG: protein-disulfide reductase DsbD family protein [Phycisphaerales bacterium]
MGRRSPRTAAWLSLTLGAATPAVAQPAAFGEPEAPDPVRARLVSERTALVPGRVNILGIVFDIDEEWHIYWPGQNDTGMPTAFDLDLPEGYDLRDPVWPAPHRYESPGELLDHVYEETTLVMLPVLVPSGAVRGETVTITASAEWLMCREACIPGWTEDLELELPVVNSLAETERTADAELFRVARQRSPRPVGSALGGISMDTRDSAAGRTVTFNAHQANKIAFYPHETSSSVRNLLDDGAAANGTLELIVERPNDEKTLVGVLEVWGPGDSPPSRVYRINIPLEPDEAPGEAGG